MLIQDVVLKLEFKVSTVCSRTFVTHDPLSAYKGGIHELEFGVELFSVLP